MRRLMLLIVTFGPLSVLPAAEPVMETAEAVSRGLELVRAGATRWAEDRSCFACHHQTLPMLAVVTVARRHPSIDPKWMTAQRDKTLHEFQRRHARLNAGEHIPGGSTTVGYALWALALAEHPPDETTTAMVTYLLKIQGHARLDGRTPMVFVKPEDGRWTTTCRRPPLQGSDVADTVLALRAFRRYATAEQATAVETATRRAHAWLAQAPLRTQEDHIWRLWGLLESQGDAATIDTVRAAILKRQRADGGWGQTDELPSDAFSTGQTLCVLWEAGLSANEPVLVRARDWLQAAQLEDGSWLVTSRLAEKAQPYVDNGDPHGEHQFLSLAATAWATAALARGDVAP